MNSKKIMDSLWTFEMRTLRFSNKKMKNVDSKNMTKQCQNQNFKKNHQMKNLLMKCIETFLIYIYIIF